MTTQAKHIKQTVTKALKTDGLITILTGAGISAESGIPTFRGQEGFWTIGSKNYMPSEMATGTTNLPGQVVATVLRQGGSIITIDIEANVFSMAALQSPGGLFLQGSSSIHLPHLVHCLKDILAG
jgi:hypothetical protein